jgi:hypothetical protein
VDLHTFRLPPWGCHFPFGNVLLPYLTSTYMAKLQGRKATRRYMLPPRCLLKSYSLTKIRYLGMYLGIYR